MGQLFSSPHTITTTVSNPFSYSLGYTQGYRLTQEDAHSFTRLKLEFKDHHNQSKQHDVRIFGVYDGHGGKESSDFVSKRLPNNIIKELVASELDHECKTFQGFISHKLTNAFFKTDLELYDHLNQTSGESSGTTAIVVVIIDYKHLFSINVGDSRCILSTNGGSTKNLSYDHKPTNYGELIRINEAQGMVHFSRVNGVLALSRAFGDFDFKNRLILHDIIIPSNETQVTVEPDIIYHEINTNDEFLIIGCDGIYDVFTNDELIHFIRHHLALDMNLSEIIDKLLTKGIQSADQTTGIGFDNMSIFIVALQGQDDFDDWYEKMRVKYLTKMELNS